MQWLKKVPSRDDNPGGNEGGEGGDADASYNLANILDYLGFEGASDVAQGQGDAALEGEGSA